MAKVKTEKLSMKELRQAVKAELEALHTEVDSQKRITNRDADFAVKAVANVLFGALASGRNAGIHGLGTLELRHRNSRMGRNPQTGEQVEIEARNAVGFTPSQELKQAVR